MPTVLETARARRTIQAFSPEPVDDAVVERALAAAHQAPCHKLTWPWRFHRVGPTTRAHLFPIALRLKCKRGPLDDDRQAALRAKVDDPPALIAVGQVLADDPMRREEDYAAVSCALQTAMLSLAEDGIGSKWGTGGLTRDPATYTLLGIDPEVERIVGFLWIGRPARPHVAPPRPDLSEVVRILP